MYLKCGLLGPTTILAHCVHLTEEEIKTLKEAGAGVAHCPNSNFSLKSGVCDVRRLQDAGVKVKECRRGVMRFDYYFTLHRLALELMSPGASPQLSSMQ